MAGPVGMPFFTVPLSASSGGAPLHAGQTFTGTVQGQAPQLWVAAGNVKVPLGAGAGLAPGQSVTVTVVAAEEGVQLRVQPQVPGATPPPANAATDLPGMLANVLRSLAALDAAGDAPALLPPGLPATPAALRSLLALFTTRGESGKHLQWLADAVARAARAGALPASQAADFAWLAGQAVAADENDLPKALRQAGKQAGRSVEARLAAALRSGGLGELAEALREDLRGQLGRLMEDKGLARFLRATGELQNFRDAAGSLMDRLAGRDLQNLRAFDEPYLFLEIPFAPDAPIRHAQIHLFGRDGGRRSIDPEHAQAVLDLSTSVLGDLWIALSLTQGRCVCTIRATSPEAVEALRGAGNELADALGEAGYPGATLRLDTWDGNRVREAAALLRRMTGVDLTA